MTQTRQADGLVDAYLAREVSRRELLGSALVAAGAAWLGPARALAASAGHLVGAGWSPDPDRALDLALDEVGGLSFIRPGDTVYFKVNTNSGDRFPHSTRPGLVRALGQRCRDHGAKRIIVGDRSFYGDPQTLRNLEQNGIAAATADIGGELVAFEADTVDWVEIPKALAPAWAGGFRLPRPVMEADQIINLPCVKTHFIAHFTMALKNAIGLVHPTDRARPGNLDVHDTHHGRLWRQIAELNTLLTPSLNILDGTRALIRGGPNARSADLTGPAYADPKLIIASRDRVATDVTGVALLQTLAPPHEEVTRRAAWQQPQIIAAVEKKVGLTDPRDYDLSGPSVKNLQRLRRKATATRARKGIR